MRALRVLGLVVVVAVSGLLSGGAAGAAPTTTAIVTAAAEVLPSARGPVPRSADVLSARGPVTAVAAAAVAAAPAAAAVTSSAEATPAPAPVALLPPPPPVPKIVPGTPCLDTARACIELGANRAWLIRGGAVEYGPVPITHGRKGFRTPPGTFQVSFKNRHHVSTIYDAPMPYSVFFNGGIAFHQGSLRQKSHGCIHLSKAAAQTFFGSLGRGEVVQVVR